jgi:hypothetical protein
MQALPLPVEPLIELRTKDFPGIRNPKGGLCNAGLAKIDGGWLLIARNNCTPGRRPPIGGKYENHLHTIWLTDDDEFRVAAHEPSQVVCADFKGCPQDVRITADTRKGYPHVLSGCYRPNMGSHFKIALGTMQQNNNVLSFVDAPLAAPIFGNGDQKNWVSLAGSIHDLGWNEKSKEHLVMVFNGGDAPPSVSIIPTPLQGNRKPRPAAPGFDYLGRRYMSYHNHEVIGGQRKYFHQFARFRDENVDIESSTPPMRFTHRDEQPIQFLTGAVVQGSDLIVSYGVIDEFNVVGRVKMENILQHLP